MRALKINGGQVLNGTINASGSKNAALPMMAAAILTDSPIRLRRVPDLQDVRSMSRLLELLGVSVSRPEGGIIDLQATSLPQSPLAPYELVRTMRASVLVLAPLLVRYGQAAVSLPGGCAIGARPIDQHLKALEALGAQISVREGYVHASVRQLTGARICFDMPTVGGTENALMAAAGARGESVIENAAREPEISALAELLRTMGADISGDGSGTIQVQGNDALAGADATVIADRIEAGTYLLAGAATRGSVRVQGATASHLDALLTKLRDIGARVNVDEAGIEVDAVSADLRPQDVRTAPFPGFATDLQAQWMSLMATVDGSAEVIETIFENRFMHVPELQRMGADVRVQGSVAVIRGGAPLSGAPVMATDLRASAGLVIAGLAANGTTDVLRIYHLQRGYELLDEKLKTLGADVQMYDRDATVPRIEDDISTAVTT